MYLMSWQLWKGQKLQEQGCLSSPREVIPFPQKNHPKPQIFHPLVKWADKVPTPWIKDGAPSQACPLSRLSVLWLSINLSCCFIAFTVCLWSLSRDTDKILVNCPITSVASQPGGTVTGHLVVSLKPSPRPWGLESRLLSSASFPLLLSGHSKPLCSSLHSLSCQEP